jgi:hypothetical protein
MTQQFFNAVGPVVALDKCGQNLFVKLLTRNAPRQA